MNSYMRLVVYGPHSPFRACTRSVISDRVGGHAFTLHLLQAVMELRLGGKGCGHPRYPGVPMALAAQRVLKEDLTAIGFFEW